MKMYRILMVAVVLAFATFAWAQSDTARIVGTVTDSTGAVLPNATVAVVSNQTSTRVEVKTQADGSYVVIPLRAGQYSVEVSAPNFQKWVITGVALNVNDVARIDAALMPGKVTETVEVTGGAPLVETDTSSTGGVINQDKIINLPLNGRNFTQLTTLVPGVHRGVPGSNADGSQNNAETWRYGDNGSAAISSNGLREQYNNFQLDGIDNNESIVNTIIFFPPIEALQEFRAITADAPAEFGRGGGAIINAVTKAGTNAFHGSAFEFLRNSKLDATPFFAQAGTKPLFIRNQFGGTFGGPIQKGKTFFFVDYQGLRQRLPTEVGGTVTVPTAKMRQGDFSELLNPAFTGVFVNGQPAAIQIYSPVTGQPYPGNIITDQMDAAAQNYLNVFPAPDITCNPAAPAACIQHNYFTHRVRRQQFNDGDARLDHRFGDKDQAFARFSIAEDKEFDPGRIPGYHAGFGSGTNRIIARSVAGNYTHVFGPSLVNEFRAGWIREKTDFLPVNFQINQDALLGIGGQLGINPLENGGITLIGGGDGRYLEYLGDGGPYSLNERTLQFSDALSYTKGKHSWKFGASFVQRNIFSIQNNLGKGFYFYSDATNTCDPVSGRCGVPAAGTSGYEVSDMLVGKTNFTEAAIVTPTTAISWERGFFAQDDWRVTRRVTLNLGMRWEIFSPPYEENNHLTNLDPATGLLVFPGQPGIPRSTVKTDMHDFGPRLGFAIDASGDGKTVVRGSYGIFYALDRGGIANQLTQNPPFNLEQFNFSGSTGSATTLSTPIAAPTPIPPGATSLPCCNTIHYIPLNTDNTQVQQFGLNVQREFTKSAAVTVGYVGTRGNNVLAVSGAPASASGSALIALTQSVWNIANSNYDSLQITVNQRAMTSGPLRGLSYLAGYTFGKATNNAPGPFPGEGAGGRTTPTGPNGLSPGLADYDVKHRFTLAGTYEILAAHNLESKPLKSVLDGWAVNSIVTWQTGTPFSVYGNNLYAALVPGASLDPSAATIAPPGHGFFWFNPQAFQSATSVAGQGSRNFLRGPGIADVDFSVFRHFHFTESKALEFRAEFFNIANHPQFDIPNIFCCGGQFGEITTTRLNSERQIQFALRFTM